jgi:hypothetical protein
MKTNSMLALVAGLIAFAANAQAASTTVFAVVPGTSNGSNGNLNKFLGQTFTTGSESSQKIETLDLYLNKGGLGTANFTLVLFNTTGSAGAYAASASAGGSALGASSLTAANALFSHTYSNAILGDVALNHTVFDVTTFDWTIQANTVYMIGVLAETTQSAKWTTNSDTSNLSGYLSGFAGMNRQSITTLVATRHAAAITTTAGATTSAVPEPSSHLALLALGTTGLLTRRRIKRRAEADLEGRSAWFPA